MSASIILIDLDHLLTVQEGTAVLEHVGDYPEAYLALREAIHTGSRVSLCVRNHAVATWFSRVAASYGDTYIRFSRYTSRDALTERWRVPIPPDISDQEIVQSGLLEITPAAREGYTFWDTVLEHFYGGPFTYKAFHRGNFSQILNSLHEKPWDQAFQRPLVARALRERLDQWKSATRDEVIHLLIHRLASEPTILRRDATHYKLLRNYPPQLGRKQLGETWDLFQKAHIEIEDLKLAQEDRASVVPEIEYYLTSVIDRIQGTEDVEILLGQMSGYLREEFNIVESLLSKHPEWLTASLLRRIEEQFYALQEETEERLAKLRRLVAPSPPGKPENLWSVDRWLRWVRDDYMPYYSWLDATGRRDATIEQYAYMFADWFYEHFLVIKHGSPEYFAFNALYQERETILREDVVTLILIIDNMNFTYFDELRRLFNQRDFSLQGEGDKPLLSLIPTATEVGKPSIMAGRGDQIDLPSDRYRTLILKEWNGVLVGKKITYLENIGELQQLQECKHDVYFLNYLAIDKILHEDSYEIGQAHAEMVHGRLKALVNAVIAFARRFQIESHLNIYVISDHGSTRIPQGIVNVLDKDLFRGVATDSHHRFIALSDEKFADLPQVVETQCYLIDRRRFKTNKHYLAARRYYRFVETKENCYVHGGLTPEEVVVPFAHFARKQLIPLIPSLRLLTHQFRYAVKSQVMLEVGNPNSYPLESLRFRLIDADSEEVFVTTIGPKQMVPVGIPVVFRKTFGTSKKRQLTVQLRYECQERHFGPQEQTFEVSLQSIMEVPDDEFEI